MSNAQKLVLIKLLHTAIWAFFVSVICFVVYAGLFNRVTLAVWIAIGLVILEGLVLLLNSGRCPLTILARRYTDETLDNFDIYLPLWLAKNNKVIFTTIFCIGVGMVVYRVLAGG